ncbi:hypothetical protein WK80_06520 [Burkholderia multivorans]|uniref:CgeB family protein n=1 Tax=Burkholderia multivorans TaxID=87883 RepID=UPI000756135E|nr:glycosyltransferase [Burkholderia multivorans]KVV32790.1 hypothetical protein WK80_06520 [Burkholderia multivorans]MBU9204848.1 glycosyltransferase [Burkholderia multivorans]MCA8386209.1 glycosyltransferase [Burkholderia multivorans]MCO8354583.1 glycosyltransferase [Burkholderia multivorans]MCO8387108.1 glycosyltransferase [Burkholderia multivorans]
MNQGLKILVAGASPDSINNNSVLRGYVAKGFREAGGVGSAHTCSLESAAHTLRTLKPDVVLIFGSCMPATSHYLDIKQAALDIDCCVAFWLHDDPYEFDYSRKIVPLADIVFSNDRWSTVHYAHANVHHLPLAADVDAHFRPYHPRKERDLFFCGVGFSNRVQLLRDCAPALNGLTVEVLGADWPSDIPFASNTRVANAQLPDMHAASLATLNVGRRHDLANERFKLDASTPGPRTFEAAASGTVQCMFIEGLEIDDYYSEQLGEILLFDSPTELRQHIEMLKDDPKRAETIATAAQQRTLREHTYRNRAETVLSILARTLSIR